MLKWNEYIKNKNEELKLKNKYIYWFFFLRKLVTILTVIIILFIVVLNNFILWRTMFWFILTMISIFFLVISFLKIICPRYCIFLDFIVFIISFSLLNYLNYEKYFWICEYLYYVIYKADIYVIICIFGRHF